MTRIALALLSLVGCSVLPSGDPASSPDKPMSQVAVNQMWMRKDDPHDNPFRPVLNDTFLVLATKQNRAGEVWVQYQRIGGFQKGPLRPIYSEREDVFTYRRMMIGVKP